MPFLLEELTAMLITNW